MWMACVPFSTPVNNRENGEHGWQDGANDLVKCAGSFGRNENAKSEPALSRAAAIGPNNDRG
jgi:hypothetical protein